MRLIQVIGNILVFCLVFGMSATVDFSCFKTQLYNAKAIVPGLLLQFILIPFLGFLVVMAIEMDHVSGLMVLAVTCSPGGSYSNWWCSLFNADLALSITMSALSTVLSILMLPFNLYVFCWLAYGHEIVQQVNWFGLLGPILMVIFAIGAGVFASSYFNSPDFNLKANRIGNFAGAALIVLSLIMANSNPDYHLWDRDWSFYFAVAMPCLLGLVVATGVTTCLCLLPPERVTVAIEVCFQNVSIPIAIAISIYDEDKLAEAIGVPVFWGISETVLITGYCIWAWQAGWTKAPADIILWEVLTTSYELNQTPPSSARQLQIPVSTRHIQGPESTRGIELSGGDGWDYVEHGDAGAKEPDSDTIDVKSATAPMARPDSATTTTSRTNRFRLFA